MDTAFLIPLAVFAAVAVLVGINFSARISGWEREVSRGLAAAEAEHRRRMTELAQELARVKQPPA